MDINRLGYVIADGDFKALINNLDGSSTFYSGSAGVDSVLIEIHTTFIDLSYSKSTAYYTYNDSPNIKYSTEYVNLKAVAATDSGDVFALIKGSANWDYARLLKIDKALSTIEVLDRLAPITSQPYKLFANGDDLFMSAGGLYKYGSGTTSPIAIPSGSVQDLEFGADGWIYMAEGSSYSSTFSVIKKLNAAGDLDPSFGSQGIFTKDVARYDYEFVSDLALSPAKNIFAASLLGTPNATPNQRISILKVLPSGKSDSTFGFGGVAYGDTYTSITNPKIAIHSNEKPLIAYLADNRYIIVQRYTSNGQLDQDFSFGGTFKFELPNKSGYLQSLEGEVDISIDSENIFITTHAYGEIVRIKLSSLGIPDPSFGGLADTGDVDLTPPLLMAYTLTDGALDLIFNESVKQGFGGLTIKNSANEIIERLSPVDSNFEVIGNSIKIPLPSTLLFSQQYNIILDADLIQDQRDNSYLGGAALSITTSTAPPAPQFWNNPAKTPSESGKSTAIDLADAIAILKMIVGLNVNANGAPLSPYQAIAADFNQNGEVGLEDAIGVLKKIVGLSSPEPEWKYFDNSKMKISLTASESLSPKSWIDDAGITDLLTVSPTVNVVGVLTGDVNGNWI